MGFEIIKSDEIKVYLVGTSEKYLFLDWHKSWKESHLHVVELSKVSHIFWLWEGGN